jgi:hypothetical protein
MSWRAFRDGSSIGVRGSEEGTILLDEEHQDGARITLERNGKTAPFAITCGIYDWMVHTRFFGEETQARQDFEAMKGALDDIVRAIPFLDDPDLEKKWKAVISAIYEFVERYP